MPSGKAYKISESAIDGKTRRVYVSVDFALFFPSKFRQKLPPELVRAQTGGRKETEKRAKHARITVASTDEKWISRVSRKLKQTTLDWKKTQFIQFARDVRSRCENSFLFSHRTTLEIAAALVNRATHTPSSHVNRPVTLVLNYAIFFFFLISIDSVFYNHADCEKGLQSSTELPATWRRSISLNRPNGDVNRRDGRDVLIEKSKKKRNLKTSSWITVENCRKLKTIGLLRTFC